jgi:hypothetical protein
MNLVKYLKYAFPLTLLSTVGLAQTMNQFDSADNKIIAIQTAQIEALRKSNENLSGKLDRLMSELQSGAFVVKKSENAASASKADKAANADRAATSAKADSATNADSATHAGKCDTAGYAERALMLRARDDAHWMRFRYVDSSNRDVFELWRVDNTWHSTVANSDSINKNMECYREEAPEYAPSCSRPGYVNVLGQNVNAYSAGLTSRWWRFCCKVN